MTPAWACKLPRARTTAPRVRPCGACTRPNRKASQGIACPRPGGKPGRIRAAFRRHARSGRPLRGPAASAFVSTRFRRKIRGMHWPLLRGCSPSSHPPPMQSTQISPGPGPDPFSTVKQDAKDGIPRTRLDDRSHGVQTDSFHVLDHSKVGDENKALQGVANPLAGQPGKRALQSVAGRTSDPSGA